MLQVAAAFEEQSVAAGRPRWSRRIDRPSASGSWASSPAHRLQALTTGASVHFRAPVAHRSYSTGPAVCRIRSSIQSLPGQPEAPSSPMPMHQEASGAGRAGGGRSLRYQTMLLRSVLSGTHRSASMPLASGCQGLPYFAAAPFAPSGCSRRSAAYSTRSPTPGRIAMSGGLPACTAASRTSRLAAVPW